MNEVVIQIVGLVHGGSSPFDGQWLVEYDPARSGRTPDGKPMTAHIVCTSDPAQATRYPSPYQAHRLWIATSGLLRSDGLPDRPLTAFNIAIEPAPGRTP
jgi:hypothetical protein